MPTNPIHHVIAVGLVVTGGLAAIAGAASAPATGHRHAADAAQASSKILFIGAPRGPHLPYRHELDVVNGDGTGQRRLTGQVSGAVWSPDGRKIAFVPGGGSNGVYVMNADGSGRRRLITYSDSPTWSPDGRQIAFRKSLSSHRGIVLESDVFVMKADGSGQRNLTRGQLAGVYESPAWSPNGREISFRRRGARGLYIMNADGSGQRRLARDVGWSAWSPDGRKIAFTHNNAPGSGDDGVYVMNADGSGQRRLTGGQTRKPPVWHDLLAWSPDGRKIAFIQRVLGDGSLEVMNADGSGQRNLTRGTSADLPYSFAWSPDGRRIAFTQTGPRGLFVINADGSGYRMLATKAEGVIGWSRTR